MIDKNLLDLSRQINSLARDNKIRISTTESCTGGLVASCLTSIEGASNYFDYGFITYSNEAKITMLGVDPKILDQFGAVSEEVAISMALGALRISKSSISIAITGIAGPSGGSRFKPVGTVCFAVASKVNTESYVRKFIGDRQIIRYKACEEALSFLLKILGK